MQLHDLLQNMDELRRQALRETKTSPRASSGNKAIAPTPINLTKQQLLDDAAITIAEMARTSDCYGTDWRHQLRMMIAKGRRTCQTREAGHNYHQAIRLNKRISLSIDRTGARPFVGVCPICGSDIEAERWQTVTICKCGQPINLTQLAEATQRAFQATHITRTPKGAAQFIQDETGIKITGNAVSMWIKRGKITASPQGDGCYRFNIGQLLHLAEGRKDPDKTN